MSRQPSEIDDLLRSLGFAPGRFGPDGAEADASVQVDNSEAAPTPAGPGTPPAEPMPSSAARSTNDPISVHRRSAQVEMLKQTGRFYPIAPETLAEADLHATEVCDLILKLLVLRGVETGFNLARQLGMRFPLIEQLLRQMKVDRYVSYKMSAAGGDYFYEPTTHGREHARVLSEQCSYLGTAPVPLKQYIDSVKKQSLEGRKPSIHDIRNAFADLEVSDDMLSGIGQAIHSGRGMFLFGPPGNGKTSMAERITKSFGDTIWIPRSIIASGEIIRLFDPNRHRPVTTSEGDPEYIDGRWVQIERPTIIAGGELRMDNLEVTYIRKSGVGEAPLQMKANCGTLLIDDFGRQRMSTDELLNRWIVPLEQRHDYLHLESGRSIQVPFDELIIFSSNLEPRDLVDEAFLRRIPYKIEVHDPSEGDFRHLFEKLAAEMEFEWEAGILDELIKSHYRDAGRPFRYCHARDLLRQIENRCTLHDLPKRIDRIAINQAVKNYFSIM